MSNVFQLNQEEVNLTVESFLTNMNSLLDEHLPLKGINKYKLKFKPKSWIPSAIQQSIAIKSNLLKMFINAKDSRTKEKPKQFITVNISKTI